ncbi:hypothetical protein GCM10027162_50200 [Streptomyces incanus]
MHDGFGFSAGLIGYVINWSLATRPWAIIPIGPCFAVAHYVIFRFAVTKFDLLTPGRKPEAGRGGHQGLPAGAPSVGAALRASRLRASSPTLEPVVQALGPWVRGPFGAPGGTVADELGTGTERSASVAESEGSLYGLHHARTGLHH